MHISYSHPARATGAPYTRTAAPNLLCVQGLADVFQRLDLPFVLFLMSEIPL